MAHFLKSIVLIYNIVIICESLHKNFTFYLTTPFAENLILSPSLNN